MTCRLCLKARVLRKSHIIPEFRYKPIYSTRPRQAAIIGKGKDRPEIIQLGLREYLLCDACGELLNLNYENYFEKLWYKGQPLPAVTEEKEIIYKSLDYP